MRCNTHMLICTNMEEDEDAKEQARREYVWRRNCEIFWEVEALWLSYLKELDYPKVDFQTYLCLKHDPPINKVGAKFAIRLWKFVREFSPMHMN